MQNSELMPWFAPVLSPEMMRVMHNLGRRLTLWPRDAAGRTWFNHVVFVESGFLAQALLNPGSHSPFMLTLSGPGSFAVTTNAFSRLDNLPRKYWALTQSEILTVNPSILLRLAEVDAGWNHELTSYHMRRAVSERLGLMVCHVAKPERRLGVFLTAALVSAVKSVIPKLESSNTWIRLPALPSRKLMASVISCSSATIDQIIRDWIARDLFMHSSGALWMRRTELLDHWVWLKPFLQMQKDIEQSVAVPDTMVMPDVER